MIKNQKPTHYKCDSCERVFEIGDAKPYHDDDKTIDACPSCNSTDLHEGITCCECAEYIAENDVVNCRNCGDNSLCPKCQKLWSGCCGEDCEAEYIAKPLRWTEVQPCSQLDTILDIHAVIDQIWYDPYNWMREHYMQSMKRPILMSMSVNDCITFYREVGCNV